MINSAGYTSILPGGSADLDCHQAMYVDGGPTLDDFFHSSVFKSDFSAHPIRAAWPSDPYRLPPKQTQPRRAAGSQKREKKEGTFRANSGAGTDGASSAESSSTVDEEVANLVQKINNAASRNAQKAAAAAVGKATNIPVSTSSSFSMTPATEIGTDGLLNKCCRCTPAATTPDSITFTPIAPASVSAVAADNAPSSTTAEPAARATILMNIRLNDFKVNELKLECKKRQLAVSGSKYQIMERLRPYEDAIVAEMEAMRAKYATETQHYSNGVEPVKLDLSVIDANTAGGSESSSLTIGSNEKVVALPSLYRESGENTVRDIINDYLQQQQQFNNKANNKPVRKLPAITIPTDKLNYGRGAGCGCVDEPNAGKTMADAPIARNNAATFSFAQMGSGGHFTLDESIDKNENNNDNTKAATHRQKQRPVQAKKRKDNDFGESSKKSYDSELYSKVSESTYDKRPRQYPSISNENDCLKDGKKSEETVGNTKAQPSSNFRELLSHDVAFSMSLPSQKMSDGSTSFPSCRTSPSHPPIVSRNVNENDLLTGCCDACGCFLSGVAQNDDENSPRPIQFDPSDPRSIANTLSNHEQMLSYQQKKIHELQRELAYSQQNLRHQQQMILMVKNTQFQRRDGESRPPAQTDFWLCQLDTKTVRNNFSHAVIQHRAQQQQLQMQIADHEQLVATEQRLQEQIHIEQCVEDIVRLIRQDPRTALLIVQLLRKYQLEHNEEKLANDSHHHSSGKIRGHFEHSRRSRTEIDSNLTAIPIDATTQAAACARCCHNNDGVKQQAPIVILDDENGSGAAEINSDSNQNNTDKFNAKNVTKKRKRPSAAQPKYAAFGTVKSSPTDAVQTEERKKVKQMVTSEGNCIDMEEIFRSVLRDPTRQNTSNEPSSPDSTNVNVPVQKPHNFGARATAYAIEKHDTTFAGGQPPKTDDRMGENLCGHETETSSLGINTTSSFNHPSARYQDLLVVSYKNALNNFVSANIRNQLTRCYDAVSTCPSDAYQCNRPKLNELKSSLSTEYSKNHAFDDLMDVLRDDQEKTSMGLTECDTMADFALGYTSDELVNFLTDENADNFHANTQHTFRDINIENARFNTYQTQNVQNGEKLSFDHNCSEICPQRTTADVGFATATGVEKQSQCQLRNPAPLCCYDVEPDAASNSRDAFSSSSSALSYSSISGSNAPSDYVMTDFNGVDDNQLFTQINKSALINAVMQTPNPHQEVDWLDNIDSIFDPEQSLFYGNHTM